MSTDEPNVAEIADKMPWRCFHCDELLLTREGAAEHFGDGNYEGDMPLCIEAATSELKALVLTNREIFVRLQKVEGELEQAEHERDCWAQAGRKAVGDPCASWHAIGHIREEAEGRALAAESALNAAPRWLRRLLRWKAESDWKRGRRAMDRLTQKARALS